MDLDKNRLDIGLFIPTIKVESKYDLKGKLLLLPLVGVGDAKLYLSKYATKFKIISDKFCIYSIFRECNHARTDKYLLP